MPSRRYFSFVCLALSLSIFACALPSLGATSANAPSGTELFKDDFSSATSGWDRYKSAEGTMDYDGGAYRMLVNALQVDFWSTPHKDFSDVRLEVDAGKIAGPDENRIGLICRDTGKQYYFFVISSDGYYGIGIFNNAQTALLGQSEMQPSGQIKTGIAVNHLRADCNGAALTLYVNGSQLAQAHDSTLTHGDVGLLAGTFSHAGVDVIFDNFVVLKP
ncbi:MAG TPA: hypothetical protein VLX61_10455 [Anaerolineales bacterium]|nr:hypothetical protein [Anaerolineales bacterium]